MATIKITITKKGLRLDSVTYLVDSLKAKYEGASVNVETHEPPTSRSDRFDLAKSAISDARSSIEELRDELQEWRGGMPENLQSSTKADELDNAISALEECISSCDEAEGHDINFPSMM